MHIETGCAGAWGSIGASGVLFCFILFCTGKSRLLSIRKGNIDQCSLSGKAVNSKSVFLSVIALNPLLYISDAYGVIGGSVSREVYLFVKRIH